MVDTGNGHATVLRRAAPLPPLPPPLGRKPPPPPSLYEEPSHSSDSDFSHPARPVDRLSVRSGLLGLGAGSRKPLLAGEEAALFAEDQVTSPRMLYFAPHAQLTEVQGSDRQGSPGQPTTSQSGIQVITVTLQVLTLIKYIKLLALSHETVEMKIGVSMFKQSSSFKDSNNYVSP